MCCLLSLWALSNFVTLNEILVIVRWSSTCTRIHRPLYVSERYSLQNLKKYGLYTNRIKDVHQKGVPWENKRCAPKRCAMREKIHDPKKAWKKDASTQWRHATCTSMNIKKRKRISVRKNIAHIKRERRGVSLGEKSSPTHMHYLIKRVQLVFIFGSNLWLSNIWGISMPIHIPKTPYISLLELGKSL